MGSPLTITATVCASAAAPEPMSASRVATTRADRRYESMVVVMILFADSTGSNGSRYARRVSILKTFSKQPLLEAGPAAGRAGGPAAGVRLARNGPQTDLKHERVAQDRRRCAGGVGVGRHVIGG